MKASILTQLQLTGCPANFRTVCLKASSLGDDHHAVIHSWCPVCKRCVHSPVVQVLVGRFQTPISVEEDGVGDHVSNRGAPTDREVGGASCDRDISGRSRFCRTNRNSSGSERSTDCCGVLSLYVGHKTRPRLTRVA